MSGYRETDLRQAKQPWYATSSVIEGTLFIGVQAVLVACAVLVAAQAILTA